MLTWIQPNSHSQRFQCITVTRELLGTRLPKLPCTRIGGQHSISLTPSEILLLSDHLVIETQSSMEEWHCSPSSSSSSSSISALASGKKDKTRREGERAVWRSLEVCSVSEEPEQPRLLPESEPSSSSYLSIKDMLAVSSVRLVPVKGGSIKLWNVCKHLLNQSQGV